MQSFVPSEAAGEASLSLDPDPGKEPARVASIVSCWGKPGNSSVLIRSYFA